MSSRRLKIAKEQSVEEEEALARRQRGDAANYREASSDDEFAKEHFMFSSDDESLSVAGKKRRRVEKKKSSPKDESDSDGDDEKIDYRIEHILGRKSMTAREWVPITDKMWTREITKGSVLQQPDEEYFDPSEIPVEKFLIKWAHASYLHVSWETEKDLIDLVGNGVKHSIKKYLQREAERRDLFEDLAQGEYFPSSYIQIERILDVDDRDVNTSTIKWESLSLPDTSYVFASTATDAETGENPENVEEVEEACDDGSDSGAESDPFADSDGEEDKADEANEADEENKISEPTEAGSEEVPTKEDDNASAGSGDAELDQESPKRKAEPAKRRQAKRSKSTRGAKKNQHLHGENCWVTVKWEGLSYSDVSFESLNDIIRAKIDYESPLRTFYKREQAPPKDHQFNGPRKLNLDHTIIGPAAPQPSFPGGDLRDYQWEGVRWMLFNLMQGRNSILADEMGLGKTIQSSALLQMIKSRQKAAGPFLVVAPLSTIVNWQREVRTWTNLDAIMYYGSQDDRELIRSYEFNFLDKKKKGYKVEVVITTPETCMATDEKSNGRMKRVLSRIAWDLVIVDEAHKLKNYESKLTSTLREEYSYRNCVLLTGTPLQNNTEELWTLLNFVGPSDFADHEDFMVKFGDLKSTTQLEELHRRIKPYLLRREKENVEKTVPPKEEIVIEVELTVPQKQYYRAIFEQKTGFLYRANMKDGPSLTNLAMELRKCCNHPYLIKGAPAEIAKHFKDDSHQDILVKSSGKMTLLAKLLPKLKADGHRVLIFSQFRMMLDIIEDCIHHAGFTYERVDGSIVGSKRQAAIDRFTNNDNIFVMLLSTKAGGVGINLTAADTVIIYDSDWNPQNDIQAQARAHRIGQTRSVTVYRLLTRKTYEMAMFRAASIKLGLDYAVMHNLNQSAPLLTAGPTRGRKAQQQQQQQQLAGISNERADTVSALSRRELENLLKHGAYDIFMEEKDGKSETESRSFVEESIEQILERSSVFMHQENDSKVQCMKSTSSSFAKASFVSAASSGAVEDEVAIDDPDFWSKVVGLSVEDQAIALGAKRKCRQNVESYKEPGMSIKSIYGDRKSAYITDSDDDSDDGGDRGGKRRRKANDEPEIVPADFSVENLQSIFTAMTNHGYGNWAILRRATKLWWSDADLAQACTWNMLANLLWASVVTTDGKTSNKGGTANNREASNDEGGSTEMLVDEPAAATSTTATATATSKFDANVFLSLLRRYKGCKVAFAAFFIGDGPLPWEAAEDTTAVHVAVREDSVFQQLVSQLNNLSFELPLPALAIRKAFQSAMVTAIADAKALTKDENGGDEDDWLSRWAMEVIAAFSTHDVGAKLYNIAAEDDASKLQKRVAASKLKLAQVEDLFEARFYAAYAAKAAIESGVPTDSPIVTDNAQPQPLPSDRMAVDGEDAAADQSSETAPAPVEKEVPRSNVFRQLTNTGDDESIGNHWTLEHDHSLFLAVDKFGAPDGKRRYVQIMDELAAKHTDIDYVNPAAMANVVAAAATTAIDDDGTAAGAGAGAVDGAVTASAAAVAAAAANNSGIHEKFTPKFLSSRVKALAKMLRCTDEELAALAKQEAATAAAAAKVQAAEAKAKAAERQLRKKHVQQVFKTIGRIGYPRSVYEAMASNLKATLSTPADEEALAKRLPHLLTWETFLQECDVTATMDTAAVQEVVQEAINVLNNPEAIGGVDGTCTTGPLEDVTYKVIDNAFEKVDTVHHIRVLLALHSEDDLKGLIKGACKIAGPDVPTFRRDTTMPVWWTLQHDLELLKLCLVVGLTQWKKLIAEPLMSTAPADFEMPPKTHGTEWVLALTAKNAEKRVQSLLRGLPAMRTLSLPVPTSPQRKSSQRSGGGGVNTLAAAFGNITNAAATASASAPASTTATAATATAATTATTTAAPSASTGSSWFSKAASKPAAAESTTTVTPSTSTDNLAAAKEATVTAVVDASVTAQPMTVLVVVTDDAPVANETANVKVEDDVVVVDSPVKSKLVEETSPSSPVVTASAVVVAVDVSTPEIVIDVATPSRADETTMTKQQKAQDDDPTQQKIEMLVDESSANAEPATTPATTAKPTTASKTASGKKSAAKKAEKVEAAAAPTKSILSFFKRA